MDEQTTCTKNLEQCSIESADQMYKLIGNSLQTEPTPGSVTVTNATLMSFGGLDNDRRRIQMCHVLRMAITERFCI